MLIITNKSKKVFTNIKKIIIFFLSNLHKIRNYKDSGVLKEVTSTPVASLNDDERKSVVSGKEIDGDTHLYLCLQDLES